MTDLLFLNAIMLCYVSKNYEWNAIMFQKVQDMTQLNDRM